MDNKQFGIEIPKVKVLATGKTITENEAKAISTRAQICTYEYADHEWAIVVDPRKVSSGAEDLLNEVQFRLAEVSDIDLTSLATKSADGQEVDAEAMAAKVTEKITKNLKFKEMAKVMRDMENAQIEMLAPAVLFCNDPATENFPSAENLLKGGKLAKVQLAALLNWWNPTVAKPSAEEKKTDDQKSTD